MLKTAKSPEKQKSCASAASSFTQRTLSCSSRSASSTISVHRCCRSKHIRFNFTTLSLSYWSKKTKTTQPCEGSPLPLCFWSDQLDFQSPPGWTEAAAWVCAARQQTGPPGASGWSLQENNNKLVLSVTNKEVPQNLTWVFGSVPALDGLWLWFSNIWTDSPTKRIFSATRMGMYEGSISVRKENCCRDGASMFSSSISLCAATGTHGLKSRHTNNMLPALLCCCKADTLLKGLSFET